jgi:hypothetical protein
MAALLNITRAYNACCAVGLMRRGIALARDYASRRRVFGKLLADQPLHVETLAGLQVEFEAAFHMAFHTAELMGKEETGLATSQERAVLRLLTPVVKLYTARQAIACASEVLESFGGAGYIEDTGLPRLLRDAQVLSIWEGTTNVLALDVLRAIDKDGAWTPFICDLRSRLEEIRSTRLQPAMERVRSAVSRLEAYMQSSESEISEYRAAGARALAYGLARTYAASLLLAQADWSDGKLRDPRPAASAERWVSQQLTPLLRPDLLHLKLSAVLGMESSASLEAGTHDGDL